MSKVRKTFGAQNVWTIQLRYGNGQAEAAREARGTLVRGGVGDGGTNPVTSTLDTGFSLPTSVTYPIPPLGASENDTCSYDGNTGSMTQYQTATRSSPYSSTLTWNANGTLASLATSVPAQTCNYVHDDLTRLASAACAASPSGWNQTFGYDAFGNISKTGSGLGVSFQPTYSTATNRRVEETNSGTTTEILYGASGAKFAVLSGGTLIRLMTPLPGGGTGIYVGTASSFYYMHPDWLGSVRVILGTGGGLLYDGAYAPYGEIYSPVGPPGYPGVFTGQNQDLAGDLYDFPAREYHPVQGRWVQPDSAGMAAVDFTNPQSWNRYGYVLGNPLALTDPTGMSYSVCELLGACGGGLTIIDTGSGGGNAPIACAIAGDSDLHPRSNCGSGPGGSGGSITSVAIQHPTPTPAKTGTITCTGTAMFTGVGGRQARADGALYSKYPALAGGSIRGGTFGTVAVQNGFLGLTTGQLRTFGPQIFVTPSNQSLIQQYKGPTGSLSVSDYGDANVQATPGVAFDIYRFPTVTAGRQFGRQVMSTTISFPIASGGSCPAGFTQVP